MSGRAFLLPRHQGRLSVDPFALAAAAASAAARRSSHMADSCLMAPGHSHSRRTHCMRPVQSIQEHSSAAGCNRRTLLAGVLASAHNPVLPSRPSSVPYEKAGAGGSHCSSGCNPVPAAYHKDSPWRLLLEGHLDHGTRGPCNHLGCLVVHMAPYRQDRQGRWGQGMVLVMCRS